MLLDFDVKNKNDEKLENNNFRAKNKKKDS